MKTKSIILLVCALLLIVGAGVVGAQGNGNGGNGGPGGPGGNGFSYSNCDPQQPDSCIHDPQYNAYNHGGMGFVEPQTGAPWGNLGQGQERGPNNASNNNRGGMGFFTVLPPASVETLPDDVIALMISGWQDEQNAYAIYASVMESFGEARPFVNIQRAEAQHIDAWEFLFERYGIAVPEVPAVTVPTYDTIAAACRASMDAEIANFGLYDTMLAAFEAYPDLYQVTLALRNASEFNHLPAFENCAG